MQKTLNLFLYPQRNLVFRKGFTLVELMVVIAMVAVLATLVMNITWKMRKKALRVSATSALKQVAIANIGYSTENLGNINTLRYGGDLIEGKNAAGVSGFPVSGSFWGRSQPYLFDGISAASENELKSGIRLQLGQLFGSPNIDTMAKTIVGEAPIYTDGSGLPVPFSFNNAMIPANVFARVSTFGDPAQVLWATYGFGGVSGFSESDGSEYVALPDGGSTPVTKIYYFDNKKALGAFLDGHVEEILPPMSKRRFE
jgi:prepilin-type N-terminal cleavage/methylation domain-containing protein